MSAAEAVVTAASSDEKVLIFQLISQEGSEVRISACGGHGFQVFSPPGHTLLPEFAGPGPVAPLFRETRSANAIKKSGGLSAMERIGGINFSPKICGGYCPQADSIVKIKEEELIRAMMEGFQFFENHFSSLVLAWENGIRRKCIGMEIFRSSF